MSPKNKTIVVSSMSPSVEVEPLKLTRKDLIDLVTSEMEEALDDDVEAARVEVEKRDGTKRPDQTLELKSGKLFQMLAKAGQLWAEEPLETIKINIHNLVGLEDMPSEAEVRLKFKNDDEARSRNGYYRHQDLRVITILTKHFPPTVEAKVEKLNQHFKWVQEARRAHSTAVHARQSFKGDSKKVVQKLIRQELNSSSQGQAVLERIKELKKTMKSGIQSTKKLKG